MNPWLTKNASGLFMSKTSNDLHEMPEEVLEGDRVVLAFLDDEDSEELLYLVDSSREELDVFLPWVESFLEMGDAYSSISAYKMQRDMANGGAFGIRRIEDGALLGEVILQWIDWKNRSVSFGYFLGSEFWGEGYATEAVKLALDYVRRLGMHRVEISAAVENKRSCDLAKRLGFEQEGVAKDAEFLHGKWHDIARFARIILN
ncbi:MAG: GNAT family protein [Hallerella sp.]|nr:GNAT family protein [Hallerella sp.]